MENLPNNSKHCFTKGQAVHFSVSASKAEVVLDEFKQQTQYLIEVAVQFLDSQALLDLACRVLVSFDKVVKVEEWVA